MIWASCRMTATHFFWNQGLKGWKRYAFLPHFLPKLPHAGSPGLLMNRFPVRQCAAASRGRSCSMKSSFFLSGIVPDFARIAHSFAACFLYPFVHFILILIESVAAKDIPPSKRSWGRFHAMLEDDGVGQVDDVVPVPWCGERIVRFMHPLWTRYPIAVTQELNRGRTKGCPMTRMICVPVRLSQRVTD